MVTSFVMDQNSDATLQDLYTFSRLYDFPSYVKQASPDKVFIRTEKLASTTFADVRNRQFNCSTKAATWMSYLFFLEKRGELFEKVSNWIEKRLDGFAHDWGISNDIKNLKEKHAELHDSAIPDEDYMMVWASDAGTIERQYPLRNRLEVKVAAEWFEEYRDHYPYSDRLTMATKIREKANQHGAFLGDDLEDLLEKQAGLGTYDPKVAAGHIRNRVLAADVPSTFKEPLEKLASEIVRNPKLAHDLETIKNLCKTIDTFDRMAKLSYAYSEKIPRPEDIFCSATFKVAKAAVDEHYTLTTGAVFHLSDFAKLALSDVRDAFGDDIANEVANGIYVDAEKMAEVSTTLPRPDAQLLVNIMHDKGASHQLKHANAVNRPSFAEFQKYAAMN